MTLYNYEFSFDWNSPADSNRNHPLILEGTLRAGQQLSKRQANISVPPLQLATQDAFCIDVCNKTDGAGANSNAYSIIGGVITFQANNNNQGPPSPFDLGQLRIGVLGAPIYMTQLKIGALGVAAGSTVVNPIYDFANHPAWTPLFPLVPTTTNGDFSFSISLDVNGPGGTKTFFCPDPEMIVEGPAGSH